MSPLWRSSVRVALAPGEVAGVRLSHGFAPKVVARRAAAWEPGVPGAWEKASAAFTEVLGSLGKRAGGVTIVLSNRFVRYALVPWNEKVRGAREEQVFARFCMEEIYGDGLEGFELRVSPARPGRARLASAVDRALLGVLRQAAIRAGLRIASIQPYLMAAHNRWRGRITKAGTRFFVVGETTGSYACLLYRDGACASVRGGLVQGDLASELPLILDRERVWSELSEQPSVLAHAPGLREPRHSSWSIASLQLPALHGFSPHSDHDFAMALT